MADALRSGRSTLWGVRVQIPPSAGFHIAINIIIETLLYKRFMLL